MSALIEELQEEHVAITETLKAVRNLGLTTEAGKRALFGVQGKLLRHLKKEDKLLYGGLQQVAFLHSDVRDSLIFVGRGMEEVTMLAEVFFDTYSMSSTGVEFAKDFGTMHLMVSQRIRREENTLFEQFDKFVEGGARTAGTVQYADGAPPRAALDHPRLADPSGEAESARPLLSRVSARSSSASLPPTALWEGATRR